MANSKAPATELFPERSGITPWLRHCPGGYAVANTDTGHEGAVDDASFALNHREKVIDFGYRAVHEMTVQSKAIVAAFYGRAPRYSYWTGCSSGGSQGLKEAQQFPMDYDGILAGAPGNFMTHLSAAVMIISDADRPGE